MSALLSYTCDCSTKLLAPVLYKDEGPHVTEWLKAEGGGNKTFLLLMSGEYVSLQNVIGLTSKSEHICNASRYSLFMNKIK